MKYLQTRFTNKILIIFSLLLANTLFADLDSDLQDSILKETNPSIIVLEDFSNVEKDSLEENSPADTLKKDSLMYDSLTPLKKDSAQIDSSKFLKNASKRDSSQIAFKDSAKKDIPPNNKKGRKILYKGLNFGFGEFDVDEVSRRDVSSGNSNEWLLGYFFRWYFYSVGNIQLGANIRYGHGKYEYSTYDYYFYPSLYIDGASVEYWKICFEVPLTLKLGIPIGHSGIGIFGLMEGQIRKPIIGAVDTKLKARLDSHGYKEYEEENSSWGGFEFEDWDFLIYGGIGVDINKKVSVQIQWLLTSEVDSDAHDSAWRLTMNYSL